MEIAAILVFVAGSIVGCSAVGFTIGAMKDDDAQDVRVLASSIANLEPGTAIVVVMRDSTEANGTFSGQKRLAEGEYRERYNAWRTTHGSDAFMPRIGDKLVLLRPSTTAPGVSGGFVGFDAGSILIRAPGRSGELNFWNPAVEYVYDSSGHSIDLRRIRARMEQGDVPFMSYVILLDNGTTKNIACEKISHLRLPKETYSKWIGLASGLLVDCGILILYLELKDAYRWEPWGH